ncbi:unnamed protein product [Absidia cylindrospora]
MVAILKPYKKLMPSSGNKKTYFTHPGSIGFLKAILKNIGNCKSIGTSPSPNAYKFVIKNVYGVVGGNKLIEHLKKEQENAQKQQPETALEYPVTKANDMNRSSTFGD